jgi:4-amino-4-deoxy-L-arabinose transferase-like glycosyltransferase
MLPFFFVCALFVGYFVVLLLYGRALIRFPFDYDQGEGFELYDAIRLANGQNIYLNNAVFPFYSSNYPPVYRLMLVPLIWVFGPHLWVGRVLTLLCTLIVAGLVALAAWRQMRESYSPEKTQSSFLLRVMVALVAGLAFLAANYVYEIAPLARAHLPMVMFAFGGILCLDRAFEHDGFDRRYAVAAVVLLIVAGFTKLQAIDALVAGFGFLLLRKPRWCLKALAICAAVTAVIVVLLNVLAHGQFWLNVVLANVNEYDINQTWLTYSQWFHLQGALIVCSVLYVIWDVVRALRARSISPITVWSYYFVAGAAMGMLTGKWGAGPAYLIAAIAASCVCTVGLLWRVTNMVQRAGRFVSATSALALLCAGVFLVQAISNVHLPTSGRLFGTLARVIGVQGQSSYAPYPYYDSVGYTQLGHLLDAADATNGWELVQIAREVKGPVWSEEAMLTLLAGKGVVTNPTQLYNLSKSEMLDTTQMIDMIKAKAFGVVIFRAQFYPQDGLIAIGQNYHWERAVHMNGFDYQVLYPNTTTSQQDK